jgi:hypothetical protein
MAKKWLFLVPLCMVLLTLTANIGLSWDNSSCAYRENLTYSNAWNDENLNEFPVLIVLNDTTINYSRTGFNDLQFYSNDGNSLPKELEYWNITGNSYVWIKDNITTGTDYFEMYYNCTAPIANTPTDVWSNDFRVVYHFSNYMNDSTINAYDGTNYGATRFCSGPNVSVGCSYYLESFDFLNSSEKNNNTADYTISAFVQPTAFTNLGIVMYYDNNHGIATNFYEGTSRFFPYNGGSAYGSYYPNNEWALITGTLDIGTVANFYKNGVLNGTTSGGTLEDLSSHQLYIGAKDIDLNGFLGYIDEVREETVARSAKWINATYLSIFNKYLTIGNEEEIPPASWVFVNNIYPQNNTINATTNDIQFGYLPNASLDYLNCSLYFGLANGTANWNMSNETAINNNTINTFSISDLLNGSYKWYASCCITGDVCNSSVDYYLNVSVAYPMVTYGNCTLYSLPTDWTNAYCLNNATLYHEKIYSLSGVTCNYSEFLECPFGCKVRSCNPSTFDMWLQNGALLIGALVALLLIFMVGRKAKGIRF